MKIQSALCIRQWLMGVVLLASFQLSADPQSDFAACVVENSGDRPTLVCADERIDIRTNFERSLARIQEREIQAINNSGVFRDYYRLLDPADQQLVSNLGELGSMLGSNYPELFGEFVLDVSGAIARLSEHATLQSEKLVAAYQHFDPSAGEPFVGPESPPGLMDFIRELEGEHFIGSGEPAEITALDYEPGPIQVQPLRFSSADGVYFFASDGDISKDTNFTRLAGTFCIRSSETCVWPSGWDFQVVQFTMVWESSTLTQQEIADIVQQNGYQMTLEVNGAPLAIGPPQSADPPPMQGYYAVAMGPTPAIDYDGPVCPTGTQCIATSIFARARLRDTPFPWQFTLKLYRLNPIDPPIIIIDPDSGSSQSYALEREPIGTASRTIVANPTYGQSFFVEAISETFKSDRCMDCHGLNTPALLAAHHSPGSTTQQFVSGTELKLEESAYVPGAHVMTCVNCHQVPSTDGNGHAFEETEWKAPYSDLQVNWRDMSRAAICRRVLENLPSHDLRMQHFSEDGRLFWAIEKPFVMGHELEPHAYPERFYRFLSRIYWWSKHIAGCPE